MVVNSRYLVFPWVRVTHLASSVLAKAMRRLANDWERIRGWHPVLCETFVDGTRFRGVCYRATDWEHIGTTTGGKKSVKDVYIKPLCIGACSILCGEQDVVKSIPPSRAQRLSKHGKTER